MRSAAIFTIMFLLAAGGGLVAWSQVPQRHSELTPPAEAIWIDADVEARTTSYPITLSPDVVTGPKLYGSAVDLDGVVTSLPVQTTGTVDNLQVVATVDGVPIVALVTAEPFHRSLTSGDRGADVTMLLETLSAAGYLPADEVDDRFGPAAAGAVQAYNEAFTGATRDRTWHADRILWIPAPTAEVSAFDVAVGASWPGSGSEVVTLADVVTGASFVPPTDVVDEPTATQVVFNGQTYPVVGVDGDRWIVGATVDGLSAPSGEDDAADSTDPNATLQPLVGADVLALPSGAIVVADGLACINVRQAERADWISVQVMSERGGEYWVNPVGLSLPLTVRANATAEDGAVSCRS